MAAMVNQQQEAIEYRKMENRLPKENPIVLTISRVERFW
jgi:hypothetical protein